MSFFPRFVVFRCIEINFCSSLNKPTAVNWIKRPPPNSTGWNPRSASHLSGRRLLAVARLVITPDLVRPCVIPCHSKVQGCGRRSCLLNCIHALNISKNHSVKFVNQCRDFVIPNLYCTVRSSRRIDLTLSSVHCQTKNHPEICFVACSS